MSTTTQELAEAGVTAESPALLGAELTDAEGDIFVDCLFNCIDMREAVVDDIAGPDLSEENAGCLVDEMGMDFIWEGTTTGLLTPEELDFEVVEQVGATCGVDLDQ